MVNSSCLLLRSRDPVPHIRPPERLISGSHAGAWEPEKVDCPPELLVPKLLLGNVILEATLALIQPCKQSFLVGVPKQSSHRYTQVLESRHSGMDAGIQSQGCETMGWQPT